MASEELNKSKRQRPADLLAVKAAEKDLTLETYLRKSVEDLEASVTKLNRVSLAQRLEGDSRHLTPAQFAENPIVPGNPEMWNRNLERKLAASKQRKGLFASMWPYFAIAIATGGISGGALLFAVSRYAVPHHQPKTTPAASQQPAPSRPSVREADQAYEQLPSSRAPDVSKMTAPQALAAAEENRSLPEESLNIQQEPPVGSALNNKLPEASSSLALIPGTAQSTAPDPGSGAKIAALQPLQEAAPPPAAVPSANEPADMKPAGTDSSRSQAKIPDTHLAKVAPDQEQKMLSRASALMTQNDISGARLIYQYLANHGSPAGAFALAESYDAKMLAGRRITGMNPDARLARSWYARAAELGSREAAAMLRNERP